MFNSRLNLYTTNGNTYVISAPDGSSRTYQQTSFAITSGANQMNRTRPYLTQWQDHFGNNALFYYGTNAMADDYGQLNRINMANGNSFVFKYDFYGRIYQAFSRDGRFVQYQYDNYGDLVQVTAAGQHSMSVPVSALHLHQQRKHLHGLNPSDESGDQAGRADCGQQL